MPNREYGYKRAKNKKNKTIGIYLTIFGASTITALLFVFGEKIISFEYEAISSRSTLKTNHKISKATEDSSTFADESLGQEPCDRDAILRKCNNLILKDKSRSCLNLSNQFIAQCGEYDELYPYINTAARNLSEWKIALEAANKIIELFPNHYNAYWIRGTTYEDKGDLKPASKDLLQVLALAPKAPEPPFRLAKIFQRLGQPCDAISPLTQLVFYYPDNSDNAKNLINQLFNNPACSELRGSGSAKIRIQKNGNAIITSAKINGKSSDKFIVDTGASVVALNSKFARQIGLNYSDWPTQVMQTANGDTTAHIGVLNLIELQGLQARHIEVAIVDNLGNTDGLLGLSFLGRFNIHMDNEAGFINLTEKGTTESSFSSANKQSSPEEATYDTAQSTDTESYSSTKSISKSVVCDAQKNCVTQFGNQ